MDALKSLLSAVGPRRRAQLLLTLAAMLAGAAAELVTIGATVPFLAILTGQGQAAAGRLPHFLSLGPRPLLFAALLLVGSAVAAAAVRLLLVWTNQRFVAAVGHDIATAIFARLLRQPYADFVRRNSSEAIAAVEKVKDLAGGLLQPAMQAVTASVMALCIIALLVVIDAFAATVAAASIAAVYVAVSLVTRKRLGANSRILADTIVSRTKIVQEGLGGIRDIILDQSQPLFDRKFAEIDYRFRRALAANQLISQAPRFVIEAAGIVAIALIAMAMSLQPGGIVKAIPVLGALAIGAQRLLPLLQQVYTGWSLALGNAQALKDVAAMLAMPVAGTGSRPAAGPRFERDIEFRDVGFRYQGGAFALQGADFSIRRGERIGIVGPTGGGKSTLLDLLMGLLDPSDGEIRIDGRPLDDSSRAAWQAQLAHVPQSIYLADDTIAANIAFGIPAARIDRARIEAAARAARVEPFVAELELGYDTLVGERGIRLSGGQRQRIGIARALYKAAPVLILDEATSALDDETENEVIEAIMALGGATTLIMVAHRRSTLAGCDRILRVDKGRIDESDGASGKARLRPSAASGG
ncbi:MAG TPA: ABC transporter ATP-binding protein [Allosphingosinicella sp.]|jgi:ATP-binding cassette subfamily B protein